MRSKVVAYLLWFFFGIFSAHRFYLKKYGTAIFYLLTLQLFGIGWIYDAFELGRMVERYNLMRGYYGPIKGLNQNVFVSVNKEKRQALSSVKERRIAS